MNEPGYMQNSLKDKDKTNHCLSTVCIDTKEFILNGFFHLCGGVGTKEAQSWLLGVFKILSF